MARLSIVLPPFSPDYSGVASVLFDLHTVTAMHDASGCTGNYTGYDEPRWYGSRSPIYCSGLREIDAVLGDDGKLLDRMAAAARDIRPELMALVGSPVPMVIGSDLTGLAAELEGRTGIPCLGFDTTGTAYYDRGVAAAQIALLERFARPMSPLPGRVNLLGATPLDFGTGENLEEVKALLEGAGYTVNLCLSMGYTLEQVGRAAAAQVNLAVSRAGLAAARYLEKRFGTPWLCGLPLGRRGAERFLADLAAVQAAGGGKIRGAVPRAEPPGEVLIIGEQVQANAIRLALAEEYALEGAAVGCLFGLERDLALPGDLDLPDEAAIRRALERPGLETVIADPFLRPLLPPGWDGRFVENPQYAVSSKVEGWVAPMVGEAFNFWIEKTTGKKGL